MCFCSNFGRTDEGGNEKQEISLVWPNVNLAEIKTTAAWWYSDYMGMDAGFALTCLCMFTTLLDNYLNLAEIKTTNTTSIVITWEWMQASL